jgi:D-alanyl-D-alanine dipeptidase
MKNRFTLVLALHLCWIAALLADPAPSLLPENFVDAGQIIPTIQVDPRYYGTHNFVGERIDGYLVPQVILT